MDAPSFEDRVLKSMQALSTAKNHCQAKINEAKTSEESIFQAYRQAQETCKLIEDATTRDMDIINARRKQLVLVLTLTEEQAKEHCEGGDVEELLRLPKLETGGGGVVQDSQDELTPVRFAATHKLPSVQQFIADKDEDSCDEYEDGKEEEDESENEDHIPPYTLAGRARPANPRASVTSLDQLQPHAHLLHCPPFVFTTLGTFVELRCKHCYVPSNARASDGRYFQGATGFRDHLQRSHGVNVGIKDAIQMCTYRTVPFEDVNRVLTMGAKGHPHVELVSATSRPASSPKATKPVLVKDANKSSAKDGKAGFAGERAAPLVSPKSKFVLKLKGFGTDQDRDDGEIIPKASKPAVTKVFRRTIGRPPGDATKKNATPLAGQTSVHDRAAVFIPDDSEHNTEQEAIRAMRSASPSPDRLVKQASVGVKQDSPTPPPKTITIPKTSPTPSKPTITKKQVSMDAELLTTNKAASTAQQATTETETTVLKELKAATQQPTSVGEVASPAPTQVASKDVSNAPKVPKKPAPTAQQGMIVDKGKSYPKPAKETTTTAKPIIPSTSAKREASGSSELDSEGLARKRMRTILDQL